MPGRIFRNVQMFVCWLQLCRSAFLSSDVCCLWLLHERSHTSVSSCVIQFCAHCPPLPSVATIICVGCFRATPLAWCIATSCSVSCVSELALRWYVVRTFFVSCVSPSAVVISLEHSRCLFLLLVLAACSRGLFSRLVLAACSRGLFSLLVLAVCWTPG